MADVRTDSEQRIWRNDFPDSRVSVRAVLGAMVSIGPGSVVYPDVFIGHGTVVGESCVLGHRGPGQHAPLKIGAHSIIRSHTVIYAASEFGERLETGHHVVIRERTKVGANLRVGNFCDIEGDCTFGDFTRLHGYVHVGKGAKIGSFVWLFSLTTATNDPLPPSELADPVTIEDGAVVCVGVTIMPGTRIRKGAFISAGAVAQGEIPCGAVISGTDGRVVSHVSHLMHLNSNTRHPWMRHYCQQFGDEVQLRLQVLYKEIMGNQFSLKCGPTE